MTSRYIKQGHVVSIQRPVFKSGLTPGTASCHHSSNFTGKQMTFATFALPTKHPICPSPPPLLPPMKIYYMYLNSTTVPQENWLKTMSK